MNRFLNIFGSNSVAGIPKFIDAVYPSTTVECLSDVKDVLWNLELHPLFFFRSSLRHSIYAMDSADAAQNMNMRLTDEDCTNMADIGIFSVGDLLQITVHGDKFIFNPNLTEKVNDANLGIMALEIRYLDGVVQNVKKYIQPGMLRQLPIKKFRKK